MLRKAGLVIECHSQSVSECQSAFIQKMPDSTLIIFFLFYLHLFIPWLSQILKTGYWKTWPSGWQLSLLRDLCVLWVCQVQILEHCRVYWNLFNIMKMTIDIIIKAFVRAFFILLSKVLIVSTYFRMSYFCARITIFFQIYTQINSNCSLCWSGHHT